MFTFEENTARVCLDPPEPARSNTFKIKTRSDLFSLI